MMKSREKQQQPSCSATVAALEVVQEASSSSSCKYKGVCKRKWGKYVFEIKLPNCRERLLLESYDTTVKVARAFDAALYCQDPGRHRRLTLVEKAARAFGGDLGNAKFNFPDNPPEIQIQVAAARFAHASTDAETSSRVVDDLDSQWNSLSSSEVLQHAEGFQYY
ncbi:ethylene-responsive transcription factor ERF017-like [Salvia miltiorrhiza]|uniref:ethylene-responsive transcription factor ERF017-like n=1 Tax=Salvia miltiorrhiza TaxID=226208 RepID=UPI0025AD0855|nr:ethylene-responsive transcription factor ERF017-like [Salvia miltiorrhiza]